MCDHSDIFLGGCSEGLDAFRFFFKYRELDFYVVVGGVCVCACSVHVLHIARVSLLLLSVYHTP